MSKPTKLILVAAVTAAAALAALWLVRGRLGGESTMGIFDIQRRVYAGDFAGMEDTIRAVILGVTVMFVITFVLNFFAMCCNKKDSKSSCKPFAGAFESFLFTHFDKPTEDGAAVHCIRAGLFSGYALGVELNGDEGEGLMLHCLDEAAFRPEYRSQTVAQLVHCLVVGAVGGEHRAVGFPVPAVLGAVYGVYQVTFVAGNLPVEAAKVIPDVLLQRSAEPYVDELMAAADPQHRLSQREECAQKLQFRQIAFIVDFFRAFVGGSVEGRFDVAAAGEKKTVIVQRKLRAVGHHGLSARGQNRADIVQTLSAVTGYENFRFHGTILSGGVFLKYTGEGGKKQCPD